MLKKYPQFDETPHIHRENAGIYCREWCPSHPEVNKIVFALIDELIDAFDADAFHVGMDRIFLMGDEKCPRCGGKDVGELFTRAVMEYYKHLTADKNVEMLMWGDRLLDAELMGYDGIEASKTGTHVAMDRLARDIIICDWHYGVRETYRSIRDFQLKGYRTLACTSNELEPAIALMRFADLDASDTMLGMLFSAWEVTPEQLVTIFLGRKDRSGLDDNARGVAEVMRICMSELTAGDGAEKINIIPRPDSIEVKPGVFKLRTYSSVTWEKRQDDIGVIAEYLCDRLRPATGMFVRPLRESGDTSPRGAIVLNRVGADESLGEEGYEITVTERNVKISAPNAAGMFYGVQTLLQLFPSQIESDKKVSRMDWAVPCVKIRDVPEYKWRGLLLDVARNFLTKDFIKRYIDLLAYHKLNRLHLHLTDDQGWRVEIKRYPKLTQVSAWRGEGADRYGGYYSQEDINDIVTYAASRYVTIVPEIEMPGHATAALAAYPWLSCSGGPFKVATTWGVHKDVFCAGNDETFEFLENVLTEVAQMFPGSYIHIGGDECRKDRWKKCPKCQARIKALGLKDERELQSYFIKRIEKVLTRNNKRLIGWDEILQGGLAPAATVQSWQGIKGGIVAAKAGHDVIMSPTSHLYIDYPVYPGQDPDMPDWIRNRSNDLKEAYTFEMIPAELSADEAKHILGGQVNMWGEHAEQDTIDAKVFPRILGLAENLWSASVDKDFDEFYKRVKLHYRRLGLMGVTYGPAMAPEK